MRLLNNNVTIPAQQRILFILFLECCIIIYSGVGFASLYGNPFFSIGVDPFSWLLFGAGVPQTIVAHHWMGSLLSLSIIFLLILLIIFPRQYIYAVLLFILLICLYVTLTGYLTHRNFQTGMFLVLLPFLFTKNNSKQFAWEAIRYFLLFFYVSSGLLKIWNHSFNDVSLFSQHLAAQFAPYYLEENLGFRTSINLYLIQHTAVAYGLMIAATAIELSMLVGFFTRRWDKWLGIALLVFHLANWCVMDIAPIGHLSFICILFLQYENRRSVY